MSVVKAMKDYVDKMIRDVSGMKILFLDEETTGTVSMVMNQSQILDKEVFLVKRLGASASSKDQELSHLKAVVFCRPTHTNVNHISNMLKDPKFAEVHLFFSNTVKPEFLRSIAASDHCEVVRQVQELYGDYFAINSDLFTLRLPFTRSLHDEPLLERDRANFARIVDGLCSVFLALQITPSVRYMNGSGLCKNIASALVRKLESLEDLSHSDGDAVLLVFDRKEDPVTPLLQQWTYQAMVHELIGIENNRVDLSKFLRKHKKERGEVVEKTERVDQCVFVLSSEQDSFFKKTLFMNYGDLGVNIKEMVESYQKSTKSNKKIDTIADMQNFVENYADYLSESGSVQKHVTLMTEMSHMIDKRNLLQVSALEQQLACEQDHSKAIDATSKILRDSRIAFNDKLRVVMLYALRYENERNDVPSFRSLLRECASSQRERDSIRLIDEILRFAGSHSRCTDLFSNKDWMAKAQNFLTSGLKDVENIYTQHQPLISQYISQVSKGKLKENVFPFIGPVKKGTSKDIFVFIVGGATYEEAAVVAQHNSSNPSSRVILGGTHMHNSESFLKDLASTALSVDVDGF